MRGKSGISKRNGKSHIIRISGLYFGGAMKPLQFLIHPDFTNGGSPLKGWKKADDIFKSLGHIAVWNINCSKKSNQSTQKRGQTIECTIGMNKRSA